MLGEDAHISLTIVCLIFSLLFFLFGLAVLLWSRKRHRHTLQEDGEAPSEPLLRSGEQDIVGEALVAERRRIARELHDGPLQLLYAIGLRLESICSVEGLSPEEKDEARSVLSSLGEAMTEIRGLVMDLKTERTDQLLHERLAELAEKMQQSTSIPIEYRASTVVDKALPAAQVNHLYLVAQECLSNAIRHSNAQRICLVLSDTADEVRVAVSDDGRGFVPAAVGEGHQGLRNMRERARLLRGDLVIQSAPGSGTTVQLRVPKEG